MPRCCFVRNCANSKPKCPAVVFHRFPKSRHYRDIWVKKGQPTWTSKDIDDIPKYQWNDFIMCSIHFKASDYESGSTPNSVRLRDSAIPSLYLYNGHNMVSRTKTKTRFVMPMVRSKFFPTFSKVWNSFLYSILYLPIHF